MTDKGQAVRRRMIRRRLFPNPLARDRVLDDFNQSTIDAVGPMGGDQGMSVLKDMNELQSDHDEYVKSLSPNVDVL